MPPRPSTFSTLWPFHSTPRSPAGSCSVEGFLSVPDWEETEMDERGRAGGAPLVPTPRRLPWTPIDWMDARGWRTTLSCGHLIVAWTDEPWTFQRWPHVGQPKMNFSW